jgi:SAM-dependent methyltransferase
VLIMLAYNAFDRMRLENKAGSVQLIENGYIFAVSEPNSWVGVRYDYGLDPNNVYSLKFKASAEKEGSILVIEVHDNTRSFSAFSFRIGKTDKQYSFGFAPGSTTDAISLRMTTHIGLPTGKITIQNLVIAPFFPIKDNEDLAAKIKLIGPRLHQLELDGLRTRDIFRSPGPLPPVLGFNDQFTEEDALNNPNWKWEKFKHIIPEHLDGKTILDIACNCGFYSFELAKRGANVIGFDKSYMDVVRAIFARKILGLSNSLFLYGTVEELPSRYRGPFDIVLCLGLLYHSWHPEDIIREVAKITDFAIFETIADAQGDKEELINKPEITSDGYFPTILWLEAALKRAGFTKIERITPKEFGRHVFVCRNTTLGQS